MGNPVFSQSSNQTLFWLIHQSNLIHSGVGLFSDYVQDVLILKSMLVQSSKVPFVQS
jgi:hypothetical protein